MIVLVMAVIVCVSCVDGIAVVVAVVVVVQSLLVWDLLSLLVVPIVSSQPLLLLLPKLFSGVPYVEIHPVDRPVDDLSTMMMTME